MLLGEFGGLHIVNPANIAVWQVVPGLKKPADSALQAELKSVERWAEDKVLV